MYFWLGSWVLLLLAVVAYTKLSDPTSGHAGHLVFPDEVTLETPDAPLRGAFRLAKDDHIERMTAVPAHTSANAWIRITSGTHQGRSGVIVW